MTLYTYVANHGIAFSEGRLPDLESEKEVFELINFGGVPQGENDFSQEALN